MHQISRLHSNLVAATRDYGNCHCHIVHWSCHGVGDDGGVEGASSTSSLSLLLHWPCVVQLFVRQLPNNFVFLVFFIELCFAFFIIVVKNCEQRCKAIKILNWTGCTFTFIFTCTKRHAAWHMGGCSQSNQIQILNSSASRSPCWILLQHGRLHRCQFFVKVPQLPVIKV